MIFRQIFLLLALALFGPQARGFDYGDYAIALQSDAGKARIIAYLDGLGIAIGMYEMLQVKEGKPRRFCSPPNTQFTSDLLAGLISILVNERPQLAKKEMEVAALAFIALERRYSCPRGVQG